MDIMAILTTFGWGGPIIIAVLLIYFGRLVPRSWVDNMLEQANKESDRWREAYDKSEVARVEGQRLLGASIEATRTAAKVVKEFNAVVAAEEGKK